MRSVLVFAFYVLKTWKLFAMPPKWLRYPLGGRDPPVGNCCSRLKQVYFFVFNLYPIKKIQNIKKYAQKHKISTKKNLKHFLNFIFQKI